MLFLIVHSFDTQKVCFGAYLSNEKNVLDKGSIDGKLFLVFSIRVLLNLTIKPAEKLWEYCFTFCTSFVVV